MSGISLREMTTGAADGPAPDASVIVLHGLGDSSQGWAPVVQMLDLDGLGRVRFVLPDAPDRPVTINGGMRMPAWYDILGPGRPEDEAGLRESMATVHALLDRERERGIDSRRIVLMGFSQGCAMALLAGLRYPHRLGAVIGLSGYVPLADSTAAERHPANAELPILMAHGTHDDVVPEARGAYGRDVLRALGQPVDWRTYPMGHEVHPQELADVSALLLKVLTPAPAGG